MDATDATAGTVTAGVSLYAANPSASIQMRIIVSYSFQQQTRECNVTGLYHIITGASKYLHTGGVCCLGHLPCTRAFWGAVGQVPGTLSLPQAHSSCEDAHHSHRI